MQSSTSEKWKRGFNRVISRNNVKDSNISSISEEPDGTISNEMEVEAYYQRLKSKTSMKNLWSGKKYTDFVEDDQTPDISTDSDDQLDLKMSNTMKNLRQIQLDSDEDEMRIDYNRETTLDENNNCMDPDSSDGSLNLMNNVHFAELEINEVDLSDDLKAEQPKDFFPVLYSTKVEDLTESDSNSLNLDDYRGLSKLDSSEGPSVKHVSNSLDEEIAKSDSIIDETANGEISEMKSIQSSYSESLSEIRSERSRSSKSHSHRTSSKSDSKKYSRHSSRSSKRSCSNSTSARTSTGNDDKKLASDDTLSDSSRSDSHSVEKTLSNRSKSADSSQKSSLKSSRFENRKSHEKHSGERKKREIHQQKDVETQTKSAANNVDRTADVLNFKYDWQHRDPSNIAAHVIDPLVIDVLTNYNPSVLAANDLMKFHMQLMQQHIENSRRLYESYSKENLNNNYKYTTIEDTKRYIEKNRPKVISYEEALKKAKKESKYT